MSQEIIYTSAPRGLKIGSKGFCTVASTRNMAKPLAERLEALSGYRHLFPPGDLRNPVTYSHIILTIAGKRYHVLSRVADAGYDYSQRSNKIAHHVALTEQETVSAGPAWLLSQPAFMASIWSREPSFFESGRVPPSGLLEPAVCETWQNVAGDAGWAGVLAETVLSSDQNEVYLIYNEAMDVLRLILEAQALLPESSRWLATFTTNYTKLPPNVECRWRCVLEGSDEAAQIQRLRHVMVLDLSKPIGQPTLSAAVDAARNGRSIVGNKAHSPTAISDVGLDLTGYSPPRDMVSNTASPPTSSTPPPREVGVRLAPPETPPPRQVPWLMPGRRVRSKPNASGWIKICLVAVAILALVAGAFFAGVNLGRNGFLIATQEPPPPAIAQPDRITSNGSEKTEPPPKEPAKVSTPPVPTGTTNATGGEAPPNNPGPPKDEPSDSGQDHEEQKTEPPPKEPAKVSTPPVPTGTTNATGGEAPPNNPGPPKDEPSDSGQDHEEQTAQSPGDTRPDASPERVDITPASIPGDLVSVIIANVGNGRIPRLFLYHPQFTVTQNHEQPVWVIYPADKTGPEIARFQVESDGNLTLTYKPDQKLSIASLSKGALRIQSGKTGTLYLFTQETPVILEPRFSKIKNPWLTTVDCTPYPPGEILLHTVVHHGAGKDTSQQFQLKSPALSATIPLVEGTTPLDIRVTLTHEPDRGMCRIEAAFYHKNRKIDEGEQADLYRMRTSCLKRIATLRLELPKQNNKPDQIEDLNKQISDEESQLRELEPFFKWQELCKSVVITITLCYSPETGVYIPLTKQKSGPKGY
jgi:hypothetical protein